MNGRPAVCGDGVAVDDDDLRYPTVMAAVASPGRAGRWSRALLRFYAVAALNTVVGLGIFAALIWCGVNIYLAQIISRSLATIFSYHSYGYLIFRSSRLNIPRYIAVQAFNYALAVLTLANLLLVVPNKYVAGLLCVCIISVMNFVLLRSVVAKPRLRSAASAAYKPYPINWSFLPDRVLLIKDALRHYLVAIADASARSPRLRPIWIGCFAQRTIDAVEAAGVLFVHVPKTGGTSICKSLYNRNLPHFTAAYYKHVFAGRLPDVSSFSIIRDPVERFISAYKFVRFGGSDIVLASRFDRARLGGMKSIDEFISFLFDDPRRLAISPTFLPQAKYVSGDDGRILVDRLFVLEPRSGFPPELLAWLGLASVPHINVSRPVSLALSEASLRKLRLLYVADFTLYDFLQARGGSVDFRDDAAVAGSGPWLISSPGVTAHPPSVMDDAEAADVAVGCPR